MTLSLLDHPKNIALKRANLEKLRTEHNEISEKLKAAEYAHENARGLAILDGKELEEPSEITELSKRLLELDSLFSPAQHAFNNHCNCIKLEAIRIVSNAKVTCQKSQSDKALEIGGRISELIIELSKVIGPYAAFRVLEEQWLRRLLDEKWAEARKYEETSLKAQELKLQSAISNIGAASPETIDAVLDGSRSVLKYAIENP